MNMLKYLLYVFLKHSLAYVVCNIVSYNINLSILHSQVGFSNDSFSLKCDKRLSGLGIKIEDEPIPIQSRTG